MLTLITGAPGAGKTAELVKLLSMLGKTRPLYVHRPKFPTEGVTPFADELKLDHEKIDADQWHKVVPDGAVVAIDEVQDVWRARGPAVKSSEAVQALEVHRHRGIDVYMTAQKPNLLDKNVRSLVGRHVHIRELGVMGRWWYEWPEVSENVAWKTAPLKKRHKLPKEAFALYKSASLHVKPIRSFPKIVLVLGAALCVVGVGSWFAIQSVKSKIQPTKAAGTAQVTTTANGSASQTAAKVAPAALTGVQMLAAARPRVYNQPETAPIYDEIRKVVWMPRIVGGFCQGGECRCYDQRGLKPAITDQACKDWIANPPFDPYHKPDTAASPQSGAQAGQVQPSPPAGAQPAPSS